MAWPTSGSYRPRLIRSGTRNQGIAVRPTRDIKEIAGMGGLLRIMHLPVQPFVEGQRQQQEYPLPDPINLEIWRWHLRHFFKSVVVPMSGSHGAVRRWRVATDFQFRALLPWDSEGVNDPLDADCYAFLDNLCTGPEENNYTVAVAFQLGDPSFYPFAPPAVPGGPSAPPRPTVGLEAPGVHQVKRLIWPKTHEPGWGRDGTEAAAEPHTGAYYLATRVMLDEVALITDARGRQIIAGEIRGSGDSPLRRMFDETWKGAGGFQIGQADQKEWWEA